MKETYQQPNPECKVCFGKHVNVLAQPASRLEACPACWDKSSPAAAQKEKGKLSFGHMIGGNTKIDDPFLFGSKVKEDK